MAKWLRTLIPAIGCALLSACGGGGSGSDSGGQISTTGSGAAASPGPISVAAYCATLSKNDLVGVGNGLPKSFQVHIADARGNKLQEVYAPRSVGSAANGFQFDSSDFRFGSVESYSALLRANADKSLLLECEYSTSDLSPLILRAIHSIESLNGKVAVVSPASDIVFHTKTLAAARGASFNIEAMLAAFESRYFRPFVRPTERREFEGRYTVGQILVGPSAPARATYKALLDQSAEYVTQNYSGFSDLVAKNVVLGCSIKALCMQFNLAMRTDASRNGDFEDADLGWTKLEEVYGPRAYRATVGFDKLAVVELAEERGGTPGFSQVEMFQDVRIQPGTLNEYGLSIKLTQISAGSEFVFGNPLGSGMAGAYACFMAGSTNLGCYLIGYHKDGMTIGIKVGNAYRIESTGSLKYELSPSGGASRYVDLSRMAQSIPSVAGSLGTVSTIRIGLIAADTGSATTFCNRCFATAVASRLAVERFKR